MKMFNYSADKMRDITEYVNSHGIKQENIISIYQDTAGYYTIVYYSE